MKDVSSCTKSRLNLVKLQKGNNQQWQLGAKHLEDLTLYR